MDICFFFNMVKIRQYLVHNVFAHSHKPFERLFSDIELIYGKAF